MPKTNDITQEPFVNYKLEVEKLKEKGHTFTVWMSDAEWDDLQKDMVFIQEPKPSTALKQLARMGSNLLGVPSVRCVTETLFINKRRRERY